MSLGYSVSIVTRDSSKIKEPATAIVADISASDWLSLAEISIDDFDVVVFMAYATTEDENYNRRVTVDAVTETVNYFSDSKLSHFIYVGSMSVFGMDLTEDNIDENARRVADNDYACNKIDACHAVVSAEVCFKISILHPTGVYDEYSKRIKMYQDLLENNYIVFDRGGDGINNIVHAKDVAGAVIAGMNRSNGQRAEEYIINGETISYSKWFGVIEEKSSLSGRIKIPLFMSSVCRSIFRKFLNKLNMRIPVYLPTYKRAMFERTSIFHSTKAKRDYNWTPKYLFKDVMLKEEG